VHQALSHDKLVKLLVGALLPATIMASDYTDDMHRLQQVQTKQGLRLTVGCQAY
jgi:hypothetical protein